MMIGVSIPGIAGPLPCVRNPGPTIATTSGHEFDLDFGFISRAEETFSSFEKKTDGFCLTKFIYQHSAMIAINDS